MTSVICLQVGNYLGRGREYLARMGAMLDRHLKVQHRRFCITDDPGIDGWGIIASDPALHGWWQKILCFKPGTFEGRCVFLDLDSVIVGSLDRLVTTPGIVHLKDWGWTKNDYCSTVMVWDAGQHAEIFERYTTGVAQRLQGDQDWMTELGGWDALPDGLCCSYRYHARQSPPPGVSVVAFHGRPKPSDLPPGHWALEHWRE